MGHSFIGGYFLNPYIQQFEDALNLAAVQYEDGVVSVTPTAAGERPHKPYSLVRAGNVGYTAIILFARDPERLEDVQEAEVGFGAADMGNKGAVGLRAVFRGGSRDNKDGQQQQQQQQQRGEVTLVATHLAAMEWNLARRNANWAAIVRGLTFANPEEVVARHRNGSGTPTEDDEQTSLLGSAASEEEHVRLQRELHDISVFKPSAHLFVAGDLNYRISTTSPTPGTAFPSIEEGSENHYSKFLHRDQLTRERKAGRTLHGLSEADVRFPPTYKYDVTVGKNDEVKWAFAPHRYPGWTDRVLFLDTPERASAKVKVLSYDALPVLASSDHRPVYLRALVPLLPADEITSNLKGDDPRVRLPVEIDPEAWERRKAARRKETLLGWSTILWSSKEGAVVLGAAIALGVGWWWLSQTWVR
jgi:hypothetical protein